MKKEIARTAASAALGTWEAGSDRNNVILYKHYASKILGFELIVMFWFFPTRL